MKNFIIAISSVFLFVGACSAQDIIKGTYAIKNVQTGMVLRIKDANSKDGTPIVAYDPVNWKCVTWDFKHVDGNTYQLKNLSVEKLYSLCRHRLQMAQHWKNNR